jgi:hypothetical protein
MSSHEGRLYHVGAKAPKRSKFADANSDRDPRVFSKLFEHMLASSTRGFRRTMDDARPMSSISAITISPGGRCSMARIAAW